MIRPRLPVGALAMLAGLFATASTAAAQALVETPYATGTDSALSISFNQDGELYAGIFGGDRVLRVPPGGGAATSFVRLTQNYGQSGIIGPDNALYVPTVAGTVVRYAPGSTVADAGPYATGFAAELYAIAFDATGGLYGVSDRDDTVRRAPAGPGGVATLVCTLPGDSYALTVTAAGVPLTVQAYTGVINRCDGAVVSTFGTVPVGEHYSLAQDAAGNVYTAASDNASTSGQIYRLAPTGGAATLIATAASGAVVGLTFRGADLYVGNYNAGTVTRFVNAAPVVVAAVPTMSEWALILLGVMLASGAAITVQRRRLGVQTR